MMFLSLAVAAILLHPIRESLSEISLNEGRKCYEVSLRLSDDDERWLNDVPIDQSDRFAQTAIEKLRQHYRIEDAQYRWIGRQTDSGHVWWHFEIAPTEANFDFHSPTLTITLLRDRKDRFHHDEQFSHRLTVLEQGRPVGYDFGDQTTKQRIEFAK